MRVYFFILLLILFFNSCKESLSKESKKSPLEQFQFVEIGKKEISTIIFPNEWNVKIYNEQPSISEKDKNLEKKLNELDYFDSIKGEKTRASIYNSILANEGQKIDSIFIIDSLFNNKLSFVYTKSFKTIVGDSYDFPPKIQEIDLLIFSASKFQKKINIYSNKSFPFFTDIKLGYLDKNGNLYTKQFETDEEKTRFVKEEQFTILTNGDIKKVSSDSKSNLISKKSKNDDQTITSNKRTNDWKGFYEITTKAVSDYNQEEFDLYYAITINSGNSAILSIGAERSEDYWCEGDYNLNIENNILHASGKCDEDDKNDFFLKYENGKYYIKSKRFIDQNWQELKKE